MTSPSVSAIKTALNSYGPFVTRFQVYEDFTRYTGGVYSYTSQKKFVPVAIDLGPATEKVYLILCGTGLRHRSTTPSQATVTVSGVNADVSYAGAQGYYVGLDQVNVLIPRATAGMGQVNVVLTMDGKAANIVQVRIKWRLGGGGKGESTVFS